MQAKIINLIKRNDRRIECLNEIETIQSKIVRFDFFDAIEDKERGSRGCALSHASIIHNFLIESREDFLLVLEDDFCLRENVNFDAMIEKILQLGSIWDVFLLGHNAAVPIELYSEVGFHRVVNAQTSLAYIVHRSFAPELLQLFHMSATMLGKNQHLNSETAGHLFALDVVWKFLQVKYRFLTTLPSIFSHRPSYSDIIKAHADYRC